MVFTVQFFETLPELITAVKQTITVKLSIAESRLFLNADLFLTVTLRYSLEEGKK